MKIFFRNTQISAKGSSGKREEGFSLLEMLVAMVVFLTIAGAAFSLFNKHVAYVTEQQNLSGVNIGLRNAMSQLELDLSGAGQNLLSGIQMNGIPQTFSLGVMIRNNTPAAVGACTPNANWAYPTNTACFDSVTVMNLKPCTLAGGTYAPVLVIHDPGNSQESLSTSSIIWGTDPNAGANLANDASCFNTGDELLVVQFPGIGQQTQCDNDTFNYCMAVVTLTKDGQFNGNGEIQLQHNPTGGSSDPLGVLDGGTNFPKANALGIGYNNGAFIIDLGTGANAVTYAIQPSATDASDTQLLRCTGTICTAANAQVLTDQVVGFKVGVALWNNYSNQNNATDDANYFFDASKYCTDSPANGGTADCSATPPPANDPYDFTLVRAIRISMIARTPPHLDLVALGNLKNGFDGGPYLVQQASVVVDLRNLSDNDF